MELFHQLEAEGKSCGLRASGSVTVACNLQEKVYVAASYVVQKGKGYVVELLDSPEAVAEVEPSLAGGTYYCGAVRWHTVLGHPLYVTQWGK
jgi:hypothetical protein